VKNISAIFFIIDFAKNTPEHLVYLILCFFRKAVVILIEKTTAFSFNILVIKFMFHPILIDYDNCNYTYAQ
jgi:hypothetical protein